MEHGPGDFRIDTTVDAAAIRVAVFGEIDLTTAPLLDEGLTEAASRPPAAADGEAPVPDEVVVDLRDLEFIDSSGLSVLISHHKALAEAGRRLVIFRPSRPAVRVLTIAGLDRILTIRSEPPGGDTAEGR